MNNGPGTAETPTEPQEGYKTATCAFCGHRLEVPTEVDLGAMACPVCRQPMALLTAATPAPVPEVPAAQPAPLKTPSVLWRRFGALGADFALTSALGSAAASFLVQYPVFMTVVSSVAFAVLWLGTAMQTGATPGMWVVELRHRRSKREKPLPTAMAAKFALTWLPLELVLILFNEHLSTSWQSPGDDLIATAAPLRAFCVLMLLWYVLLFISTLSTKGKRNLADLVCGTRIDLCCPRFLSTGRRISAWALSVAAGFLFLVGFVSGVQFSSELKAAEAAAPVSSDPVAIYQPEEIHAAYQGHVFQVSTQWNRSMLLGLLSGSAGSSGSAWLFVNDREYGLLVSNRHVVDVGSGYLDGYECVLNNDLQSVPVGAEPVAFARSGVDLALLLIRVDDWEPGCVPIMPVAGLQVGEQAVALGNALNMGISTTSGNISRVDEDEAMVYIRTSTPISPGNSGGPLILTRGGYACGINTLATPSDSAQNVNFAIPAEYIVYEELWEFWGDSPRAKSLLATARECLQ